jgi:hypothetical protein
MTSVFGKNKIKEENIHEKETSGAKQSAFQVDKSLPEILNESANGSEEFSFKFFDGKSSTASQTLEDQSLQQAKKKKKKKKKKNTVANNDVASSDDDQTPVANTMNEQEAVPKALSDKTKDLTSAMKNLQLQSESKASSLSVCREKVPAVKVNSKKDSKKEQQSKKSKSKQNPDEDDDMAFLDSIIAEQQQQLKKQREAEKSQKKKNKKTIIGSGPRFMSSKDPSLNTEQQKFMKFGKAKNLVSKGGMKVKDPNWLSDQAAEKYSTTTGTEKGGTIIDESRVIRPPSSTQNLEPVVYHQSPFTFSFGGL